MSLPILIIGGTSNGRKDEARSLVSTYHCSAFDSLIFPDEKESAIKIEYVRRATVFFALPPRRSDKKIAVFYEMQNATLEAQNALLKLLEEPPSYAVVILTSSRKDALIPTVLSRVSAKNIAGKQKDGQTDSALKHSLLSEPHEVRFSAAAALEPNWIEEAIVDLRNYIRRQVREGKTVPPQALSAIKMLNRAQAAIVSTNTSKRLLLENLFLSLPVLPRLEPGS